MSRHSLWTRLGAGTLVLFPVILGVLLVASAAAAPPDRYTGRTSNISAAGWSETASIGVNSTAQGTSGYVSFFDGTRRWNGDIYAGPDALSIDGHLGSATLEPTTVWLYAYGNCYYDEYSGEYWCDYDSKEVTVSATFEGTGKVQRFSSRDSYKSPPCSYSFRGKAEQRSATGTLIVGDQTATLESGYLLQSQERYRSQCK